MKSQQLAQELGAAGTVGLAIVIAISYIPSVTALAITELHLTLMGAGLGVVLRFIAQVIRKKVGLPTQPQENTEDVGRIQTQTGDAEGRPG